MLAVTDMAYLLGGAARRLCFCGFLLDARLEGLVHLPDFREAVRIALRVSPRYLTFEPADLDNGPLLGSLGADVADRVTTRRQNVARGGVVQDHVVAQVHGFPLLDDVPRTRRAPCDDSLDLDGIAGANGHQAVSYTHLRAHETPEH